MPQAVAQEKARKYAAEIVPAFNAYIYFRIGYWLAKKSHGWCIGYAWVFMITTGSAR